MKKLSSAQEVFCLRVAEGCNQAEAYRQAYPGSEKWKPSGLWAKASNLMARDYINARVKELQTAAADKVEVEITVLLREALRIATSDIAGIIRDGKVLLPNELDAKTRAAVASFEIDEYGRVKYKFWDKNAALEKLFKHKGLYEADNKQKPAELVTTIRLVPLEADPDKPTPT